MCSSRSDREWREILTESEYRILREHGTERPFSHPYHNEKDSGIYHCAGCGCALFSSSSKFDSGTGWPSFSSPISDSSISERADHSLFMHRTEVLCSDCGGHLGHVFTDGPRETTGLRYCINGGALKFTPKDEEN